MSGADFPPGEGPGDPDAALAAEYVLRLLDPAEEAHCAAREAADPGFAALAGRWRADLASLDEGFAPVAPPARLARAIEARLFGRRPSRAARLWNSVGLWRGVAAAAVLAAIWLGPLQPPDPAPQDGPARLISAVASVDSDVELLAVFEPQQAVLSLNRVSGAAAPGRALELWLIAGEQPPVSLGLLPDQARARVPLDADLAQLIGPGVVLAVSDEPPGGSPTGAPTGPVLAAGPITEI